jgi:hypothetical protein
MSSTRAVAVAVTWAFVVAAAPVRADTVDARCDVLPKGAERPAAPVACTFSQRQGFVGIELPGGRRIDLSPAGDAPGTYTDAQGRPAYRQSGLGKDGQIYRLAEESVYVYWDASTVAPAQPAAPDAAAGASGFDTSLEMHGIRFRVRSANDSSLNTLRIEPSGLETDNTAIEREIDGTATGAEIADLDADGSPEVYVYVNSAGSGSYGSLVAVAANRRKSLSDIFLPSLADDPVNGKGYMGHDAFAVGEGRLLRRFPLYREGDTQSGPTGKTRQLQYRLEPGEAGWVLRVDRTVEY